MQCNEDEFSTVSTWRISIESIPLGWLAVIRIAESPQQQQFSAGEQLRVLLALAAQRSQADTIDRLEFVGDWTQSSL
jgi:hypothetical protein